MTEEQALKLLAAGWTKQDIAALNAGALKPEKTIEEKIAQYEQRGLSSGEVHFAATIKLPK